MKFLIFFLLIIIVIFGSIFALRLMNQTPNAEINGKHFDLLIARTDVEKEKGLSIYKSLPQNKGMIFPYDKSEYYTFWMKDMKFPIDIIYINNSKIVDIFENVAPPKTDNETLKIYKPRSKSNLILEINAGLCKKYDLKIGDIVKIDY